MCTVAHALLPFLGKKTYEVEVPEKTKGFTQWEGSVGVGRA